MPRSQRAGYQDGNSTADRTLAILEMFSEARSSVSAADVASHLGLSRSTAYRYLKPLVNASFLVEDVDSGYCLGPRVLELSVVARRSYEVTQRAVPVMKQLADQFKETVLLTKRVGSAIVCLEREECADRRIRLSYERGSQLSLNAGASAFCVIAWDDDDEVRRLLAGQPLPRYTPATLTTVDDVLERLATIRRSGYAVAAGEVDHNVVGVAAPIFKEPGSVLAVLSIVMIASDVGPQLPAVVTAVRAAAQQLTREQRLLSA